MAAYAIAGLAIEVECDLPARAAEAPTNLRLRECQTLATPLEATQIHQAHDADGRRLTIHRAGDSIVGTYGGVQFRLAAYDADSSNTHRSPQLIECAGLPPDPMERLTLLDRVILPIVRLLTEDDVLALHASAVASVSGQVFAFAGQSGVGKSTLAHQLTHRGFSCVTDDLLVVESGHGNGIQAVSGAPWVKLIPADDTGTNSVELPLKRSVEVRASPAIRGPLRAVFVLTEQVSKAQRVHDGARRLTALLRHSLTFTNTTNEVAANRFRVASRCARETHLYLAPRRPSAKSLMALVKQLEDEHAAIG